jgi:hypothetical protein
VIAKRVIILGTVLIGWSLPASIAAADDPVAPSFQSTAGAFVSGGRHDYFVESELRFPFVEVEPAIFSYHYRETTPFFRVAAWLRAEVLYRRNELQADLKLNDSVRLIAVGGYESTGLVDRPGLLSAFALGAGIGSWPASDGERLNWSVLAGKYISQQDTGVDWWSDLHASWRAWEFAAARYGESEFHTSLALSANVESANDDGEFHALYRIGPELQLQTANGNRAAVQFQWYRNDGNRFYGSDENGWLFNFRVDSTLETNHVFNARQERNTGWPRSERGWLPLIWGAYDVGIGSTRRISRFEMNVEFVDFAIRDQVFTGFVWYESRQEYRIGDFDNIAYSVTLGLQTPIGLESVASHGDPVVLGADFLHRSDHSLNPDATRVPAAGWIDNGNHNLLPRLRLQTAGWDLPYRDPGMYRRATRWLNLFDWRVTAGWDIKDTRDRGKWAGQLGLNWDAATVEGYVVYLRGIGSIGNETPDWLGEFGVRRPAGKVFARYEQYGMRSSLGHGDALVLGIGVNL